MLPSSLAYIDIGILLAQVLLAGFFLHCTTSLFLAFANKVFHGEVFSPTARKQIKRLLWLSLYLPVTIMGSVATL